MTEGPILSAVIKFVVPLMLAGVLQVLYNAADIVVVGQFGGDRAVAEIGATTSIIALIANVVIALAVGSNIMLARYLGARDEVRVSRTVHTSCAFSLLLGLAIVCIGELTAIPLLRATNCPEEVLSGAALYLRIYYLGAPASFFYNFMSSVIRTRGDSRRPLYYLAISGLVNVLLNLLLVTVFDLGVAGVAIATVVAQYLSAIFVLVRLVSLKDCCRLDFRRIRFHRWELGRIARLGIPSAITNAMYSFSNLQIQSAINAYGDVAIAGNTASVSLESFIQAAIATFATAAATFVGQNIGAGKRERVSQIRLRLYLLSLAIAFSTCIPMLIFGRSLLSIYVPNSVASVDFGMIRMRFMMPAMMIGAINQVNAGTLQSFGYTLFNMVVSIVGVCGFRLVWMYTVYPRFQTPFSLYICYPISWFTMATAGFIMSTVLVHRFRRGTNFQL